jgi:transposase-like protein
MGRAKYKSEQIFPMLREAEVEIGQGMSVRDVCRKLGIHEHTYYHWRKEYGGLKLNQVKRLKDLELENSQSKRVVAELTLDERSCRRRCGEDLKPGKASLDRAGGPPFAGRAQSVGTAGVPGAGVVAADAALCSGAPCG